ncbi:MAG: aminoacyl-tRNA hydrolase [Candidatus Buchananbacteria bacterium RIFCSPHIGHO2_02_FULL_40_13]|uniref:Peptidyl-tRNA hydrolase n=1 Tax=Candidatus Buchananbacteria bacterium RIFCSPLOWO2_01_FULL_39_33 TaxID=1797543 RepID=A0A1G1YHV1_9BACT|nr:MAG: aminoacyl-tRNA hydrolase [Candidatus Buchananbacteria bacterium RIFCSPHIGHO2_01_FULL_40_35]OGY49924.1 MAG: aminoacyl-tRNA hydrolase [Candidatus Buchananbacteria bacterium RIFCSPHIGHO2_02_FULL_40_13]OGY51935.1 MAG: aminoacyl-tRNA hydrolase [Candidatus Buchananbacteria bacterium RIFCSPLOWO2_01_FULL_39_33]
MKLIVGLGNPGKAYLKTWHNIGFLAIDNLADDFNFSDFKETKKFKAEITTGQIKAEKIILAKPTTYMNSSGEAVGILVKYYKLGAKDIIIIHDDIDLPLGRIKIVKDASAGGHNGVKSIIQHLKTQDFIRIRLGVATPKKEKMDGADYVLTKIGWLQSHQAKEIIKKTASAVEETVSVSLDSAMNKYN